MKRRQMIACLLGISIVFPIFGVEKSAYAGVKEHVCGERNPSIYNLEETVTKRGIIESQDTVTAGGIVESPDTVIAGGIVENPDTVTAGGIVENPDTVTPGGIVENPDTVTPGGIVGNPETVTGGGIEDTKKDTVVVFDKSEYKIPYTRSKKIYANAINKKGEAVKVTYKSANPKVAKVDEKGNVTGVSVGTTAITATAEGNPKATAVCTIHVYKQKKGWYETKSGKKYYVKKDGTRCGQGSIVKM